MNKKWIAASLVLTATTPALMVVSCGKKNEENHEKETTPKANIVANGVENLKQETKIESGIFSGGVLRPQTIAELKLKFPNYYGTLNENARGKELFDALHSIQIAHAKSVPNYGTLWETYKTAFVDKYDEKDGTILDIYSEKPEAQDPYNYTPANQNAGTKGSGEGVCYDREHLIPQSVFCPKYASGSYKQNVPSHNDAHFIFPGDRYNNIKHSDNIYDDVVNVSYTSQNGSKLGTNASGQTSFEPINAFKGDVARATMYFALTWRVSQDYDAHNKPFAIFTNDYSFPALTDSYQDVYTKWSDLDPVSQWDVDRNEEIAKVEGGLRNPFTDMPELAKLIWN